MRKKKKPGKRFYTPEQLKFLKKIYKGRCWAETTKLFNRRFRLSLKKHAVKSYCLKLGMKSGFVYRGAGNQQKYFDRHINFLRKFVPGRHYSEILPAFNSRFGFKISEEALITLCKKHGIKTGFTGHFEKGHVSHNKGRKGFYHAGCEVSWFKKGHKPLNWRPIGSERINRDGYLEVKVSDTVFPKQKRWRAKRVLIWEKKHGPVPASHCVIFLDQNRNNVALNNLTMVTRQVNAVMCHMNLFSRNREITRANCAIATLKVAVANKKRSTFTKVKKKMVFLNNYGKIYFVTRGMIGGKERYFAVRKNGDKIFRLRVKKLKTRATFGEAQRDLYNYAFMRGWMAI